MERTKLLTIAVIGLLLLNLLTIGYLVFRPVTGPRPERNRPPGEPEPATIIIERLHFDAGQQQRYQQLIARHRQQTRLLGEQSAQLYRAYYGLLTEAQPDTVQTNAFSQQIARNQRAQAQLNFAHFNDIKQLCRGSQLADFRELVGDLSRLFGRQPRVPRPDRNGPPGDRPEGAPDNLPPHP